MEREFHQWLQSRLSPSENVQIGVGDDAAVLAGLGNQGIVVTTDSIAEGTHFQIKHPETDLIRIGRKALAVNLSDIAAMGASPIAAVLTFLLPRTLTLEDAIRIFEGCEQLARQFHIDIVGGDTNTWTGPLVLGATVVGSEAQLAGQPRIWKMNGALAGDQIVVTGSFGGSILGKHLDFVPRVELAKLIASTYEISAATDVSDSLSLDLAALAAASGVGVQLIAEQVPVSDAALKLAAQDGLSPLVHALTDGEDFELVLAVPPNELTKLVNDSSIANELSIVGTFIEDPGFYIESNGIREPFQPVGYSH